MNASRTGTEYLTVDAFLDRLDGAAPGHRIVYATGDLAYSAPSDPDLHALRYAVWRLYEAKKIALTQRVRNDKFFCGGRAFDYIATRRRDERFPGKAA
jgi:hypothetical protein